MSHYHRMQDGHETGNDIIDKDDDIYHYHMVDGERTTKELLKDDHTHTINDLETSTPIEKGKSAMSEKAKVETKQFNGRVIKFKEMDIDGVRVGLIEGYIATWDIDRGGWDGIKDQFARGAFRESIADYLKRNRMIRFKDNHGRTLGGFRIDSVREDDIGLYGIAEVNLDVQQGADLMSLVRQGVLTDFSIGFSDDESTTEGDLRTITKATIWEGSIVDEPMNPFANVVGFKSFQNMEVAVNADAWNLAAATDRMRKYANNDLSVYDRGFVHGLPIADIADDCMVVIPEALDIAAKMVMSETFPEDARADAIKHLERYYAKMQDVVSPFDIDDKMFFVLADIEEITPTQLEKALKRGASFNKRASKFLISKLKVDKVKPNVVNEVDKVEPNVDNGVNELIKSLYDSITATKV